jgi:hypothetical protein
MSSDHTQVRLQRIEEHLESLDDAVAVLGSVDDAGAKAKIARVFADPRIVLVYRGVQRGLNQSETAATLKDRGLLYADQGSVSRAREQLLDENFLKRDGKKVVVQKGWEQFGIEKALKKILKKADVRDLD